MEINCRALRKISYGLYVVSSGRKNKFNGQIANTVFQITSEPPIIAVSINKQNLTHQFIKESGKFSVSVLSKNTPLKFIDKVIEAEILKDEEPMTYAHYHKVKRGKTPKTAPTYIKEEIKKGVKNMLKYRCKICGYVYDPEKGEPDSGINPGTPFEELPEDWVCPVCGAGKEDFEKEE